MFRLLVMESKFIVTVEKGFYTPTGILKYAIYGKLSFNEDNLIIGDNNKTVVINENNVVSILRCDEKPIQLNELGFPETIDCLLKIYIAE